MTRRTVLSTPLLAGFHKAWSFLSQTFTSTISGGVPPASAPPDTGGIVLENANHRLKFDGKTARLVSFRAIPARDQEFVLSNENVPVFVIQCLADDRSFGQISSTDAAQIKIDSTRNSLAAEFTKLGGRDLSARVTVRMPEGDAQSHWSISIRNGASLAITDVQFPFVITRYNLGGKAGSEAFVRPYGTGRFWQSPQPQDFEPDSPHAWQFRPENTDTAHYPGMTFAQFLGYYNDRAGIYAACQDPSGAIKLIKPVHHPIGGIRLGFAHVGDWPASGERDLGYDVVLQAFQGDWYEAATLYREWALKQTWAAVPLHKRTDVPDWLLDSPPHIIVRMQGELDAGPAPPNPEFLPYPKVIPLLEKISQRVGAPLVAVVMSWERPGPWVYPDCFPPVGGDASLHEFSELARARGWHVGSFCNGTRWVTHHYWTGYDGEEYLAEQRGAETICRTHDQQLWRENWAEAWRPSYACCLGVARTREIADNFVQRLVDDGLDWVQFLDQNVGCATFPCWATDHGHPPMPGRWMNQAMQSLLDSFRQIEAQARTQSATPRQFALSVEYPPNEVFIPYFQVCDQRVAPPGHTAYGRNFFPLYTFLYHEFLVLQGGFGAAPEPYHMPIRSAYNLVAGEIPGGVLTGDGSLLNRDTFNWAPWSPPVGNNDESLTSLRSTAALRRGAGRDYLVFGRMQRPADIDDIETVQWEDSGQIHRIAAVFHSAWQSPQGRFGIVLANWTNQKRTVTLADPRLGVRVRETVSLEDLKSRERRPERGKLAVTLPPFCCALVESA